MLAMIAAGAGAPDLMNQFQQEKEGLKTTAYPDGRGIWTICGGVTHVNNQAVKKGMKLTSEQCKQIDEREQAKALEWVDENIHIKLTEPQKVGIASFCPWNIGVSKCFNSTFFKLINENKRKEACQEIKKWIFDGGRDCRKRENNCAGQVIRRDQEAALACWNIDD